MASAIFLSILGHMLLWSVGKLWRVAFIMISTTGPVNCSQKGFGTCHKAAAIPLVTCIDKTLTQKYECNFKLTA